MEPDDIDELGVELAHGDGDAAGFASTAAREEATASAASTKKIRSFLCIDYLPGGRPFPEPVRSKTQRPTACTVSR